MALKSDFNDLSNSGFGNGSGKGSLSGNQFGIDTGELRAGKPIAPEHVLRLYQVLVGDTTNTGSNNTEVGINGLLAVQNLKVNNKIKVEDFQITGTFTLSGGLTVPGNLTAEGDVQVEGEFNFKDSNGKFGDEVAQALEPLFTDSPDVSVSLSGSSLNMSLNDNTVNEDELDTTNQTTGFLQLSSGSLSYAGLNTSSEFDGEGYAGDQLSIADSAIDNAELANMTASAIKASDLSGNPQDFQPDERSVLIRRFDNGTATFNGQIESLQFGDGSQVLISGDNSPVYGLEAVDISNTDPTETDFKDKLNLKAEDINAGEFDEGNNQFSFAERLTIKDSLLITGSNLVEFRGDNNSASVNFKGSSDELEIAADRIFIDSDGSNIDIESSDALSMTADSLATLESDNDLTLESDSSATLESDNDLTLESTFGNVDVIANNRATIKGGDHIVIEGDSFSDAEVNNLTGGTDDPSGTINLGPGIRIETYDLTGGGKTSFLIFAEEGSADYSSTSSSNPGLSDSFIKQVIGENESALYHIIEGSGGGGGSEDSRINYIERQPNDGGPKEKGLID